MINIPGYSGKYSVTEDGQVYSHISNKFLRQGKNSNGYLQVSLYVEGKQYTQRVHRLVLLAFIGPSKLQVNHINGDKL